MTLLKFTLMQYAIMKNESCCNDLLIICNYFLFYYFHLNHNSRLIFPPCFSVLIPDFCVNFTFSLIAWFNVKLWVKMLTKLWNIDSGFSFCHCCQVWTIFAAFLTFFKLEQMYIWWRPAPPHSVIPDSYQAVHKPHINPHTTTTTTTLDRVTQRLWDLF